MNSLVYNLNSARTKAAVQINKDTNDTGQASLDEQL